MPDFLDWRIVAILAMLLLSAYNLVLKWFLEDAKAGREDPRSFIPVLFIASLLLLAYFALTYKDLKTSQKTLPYIAVLSLLALGMLLSTLFAYAYGELTTVVSILALSLAATALLAFLFLGEKFTPVKLAGILLALLSILVLAFEKSISAFFS